VDKATLLKGFLPERDVELPSGTGTVRVRGLSRQEAVAVSSCDDEQTMERMAIVVGLIDPVLSLQEVTEWSQVAVAADVQAVAQAISQLSNMEAGAGKGPTSRSKRTRT
jgi:uncharacterized linocin/CFP29 family protein